MRYLALYALQNTLIVLRFFTIFTTIYDIISRNLCAPRRKSERGGFCLVAKKRRRIS